MNHDEAVKLLGAYRDGELDLGTCLELEEHLAACPACQRVLEEEQKLVDLLQAEAPRHTASPFLKTRILATLREEGSVEAARPSWERLMPVWVYGVSVAVVVGAILLVANILPSRGIPELAQEGIANHVRSLQVNHLTDVASTDQHTVKPWFAGKLDYSPQIIDLTPSGYPLIGGRLDVLDHRTVAAVVYQRRKHYINLFIWPADTKSLEGRLYNENGYHALGWAKSGMNYLAVSELGEGELRDFVHMIQEQTVDSRSGE